MGEAKPECHVPPEKKMNFKHEVHCKLKTAIVEADVIEKDEEPSNQSKYSSFVTPEELETLSEFQVLDEVKSNDEDSNDDFDISDGKSEVPEDGIEKMLEEDLPDGFKGAPQPKKKQKIVLEEKGVNHREVLPLDWMMVRHYSGMPVYMHRITHVCTLSKPYFLGNGNTRLHDIPISAIPCLSYRKTLEEEKKQQEIDRKVEEQIKDGSWVNNLQPKPKESTEKQDDNAVNATSDDTVTNDVESIDKCPYLKKYKVKMSTDDQCAVIKDNVGKMEEPAIDELTTGKTDDLDRCDNEAVVGNLNSEIDEANDFTSDVTCANKDTGSIEESAESEKDKIELPDGVVMPAPKVETINNSWKTQHLSHEQLNDYCKKLFKFKTVDIMHFNRWADRRNYTKARKTLQHPTLPDGTVDNGGKAAKRDWVKNKDGRSYLSVFHEYVRRALQKQPVYEFLQLENAATPYQATVYIGGMQYGVGHGSSKRQAKSAAARASIHILIPEMKDELDAPPANEPDFSTQLAEERGLAAALATSQAEWQARAKLREDGFTAEVAELKEQLRDVMFFVEARSQLAAAAPAADLAAAAVSVAPPPAPRRTRARKHERS